MSDRPWLPEISEVRSLPVIITLFLLIAVCAFYIPGHWTPSPCATRPFALYQCSSCAGHFPIPASCPLHLASPPQRALPTKLPLICLAGVMAFICNPYTSSFWKWFFSLWITGLWFFFSSNFSQMYSCVLENYWLYTATYTVRREIYDWPVLGSTQ